MRRPGTQDRDDGGIDLEARNPGSRRTLQALAKRLPEPLAELLVFSLVTRHAAGTIRRAAATRPQRRFDGVEPGAYARPAAPLRAAVRAPSCERLSAPRRVGTMRADGAPRAVPAGTAPCWTPCFDAPASGPGWSRATAGGTVVRGVSRRRSPTRRSASSRVWLSRAEAEG